MTAGERVSSGVAMWRGNEGGVVAPPAPSPDGRLICFSYRTRGTTSLYVVNANGTNARRLSDSLDVRGAASWSPDGKWVVIAANKGEGTRLFKVPVAGGQPVQLLDTLSFNPVWSPDGRFIHVFRTAARRAIRSETAAAPRSQSGELTRPALVPRAVR